MNDTSKTKTLLIIDDDKNITTSLTRLLARDGYEIHTFTRSIDALTAMQEIMFGVILSDQCMPHMEGSEFLRLAERYQPKAVKIIISGYYHSHSVAQIVEQASAWRYIAKPWDNDHVRALVREAFARFERVSPPSYQ